jgi:hypothetical protein
MIRKKFSIAMSHFSDELRPRGEARDDGLADQIVSFTGDGREHFKPAFALHERHDRLFTTCADHGFAFSATNLTARLPMICPNDFFYWRSACAVFFGNEVASKAHRLEPCLRRRVSKSFRD